MRYGLGITFSSTEAKPLFKIRRKHEKGHRHENHFKNSRVQKHIYSNGNLQEVAHFVKITVPVQ